MKIQTKFMALALFAVLMTLALVGVNFWAEQEKQIILHEIESVAEITQRQLGIEAEHDAVRASVLTMAASARAGDTGGANTAAEAMATQVAALRADYAENQKQTLPPELAQRYVDIEALLNRYTQTAEAMARAVRSGNETGELMPAFDDAFTAFHDASGLITEHMLQWGKDRRIAAEDLSELTTRITVAIGLLTVLVVLLLPIMATRAIFRPQRRLINVMDRLAHADYEVEVPGIERADEMGEIARAVQSFKENGQERVKLEKEQEAHREVERAEDKKRAARAAATDAFATRMKGIIENVAAAATEMYHTSEAMGYSISSASTRVGNVAAASTQTSMNVQSVAAAAEELSATVREIAEQISRSNTTVRDAVGQVTKADATALSLDEATQKIGQIVEVIQTIASQINLLALNATIESARAGEAGKGFAVVAGEVKTLATQTSRATDEIASNIASIQSVSQEVIASLQAIKGAIARVDEISAAISAAVEEQNATTNEIASNMGTAATGTSQINDEINQVSVATAESSDSAAQVLEAAKMLSQEAESLSKEVHTFLTDMAS